MDSDKGQRPRYGRGVTTTREVKRVMRRWRNAGCPSGYDAVPDAIEDWLDGGADRRARITGDSQDYGVVSSSDEMKETILRACADDHGSISVMPLF